MYMYEGAGCGELDQMWRWALESDDAIMQARTDGGRPVMGTRRSPSVTHLSSSRPSPLSLCSFGRFCEL